MSKQTTLLVILLLISAAWIHLQPTADISSYPTVEYVVRGGDTLWSIAAAHKPAGIPMQEYIYHIRVINEITPIIHPGQVLEIIDG